MMLRDSGVGGNLFSFQLVARLAEFGLHASDLHDTADPHGIHGSHARHRPCRPDMDDLIGRGRGRVNAGAEIGDK